MPSISPDTLNAPYQIAILDDPLAWANSQDWSGGEDSFRRASLIDENQAQHLLNVWVRDNYEARTRPGADAIPAVSLPVLAGITNISKLRYFETQTYAQLLIIAAAGGTPKFLYLSANGTVTDPAAWAPSATNDSVSMAVGIDKAWITDGVGNMQTWTGAAFADQGNGFTTGGLAPTGVTILCWHTARLFASGLATARDTIYVSTLLPTGDGVVHDWDFTNRAFRIGVGDGDPVVAMASMQSTVLCVLKRNSIWLVNTDPSLDSVSAPAKITGFTATAVPGNIGYGIGCVGRDAWAAYGNDILFMAQDGVRSVQRMQAAQGQWQLTSPLSQPIQPYIQRINQSAWSGIVAKSYQEFVFFFVPLDNSATNNYVLVYNARLQRWMGAWTKWNGNCVENTRFNGTVNFVFGDTTGKLNQWKDKSSNTTDNTYTDNGVGYPTQIWSKSYQFGEVITNKSGYNLLVRFTAGNATVLFTWMADLAQVQQWSGAFQPTGDILGVDVLPFLLSSTATSVIPNGIRGLPDFQEAFLRVETAGGWIWLRSIAASAFQNPLKEIYP